ncbi:MAG TPA: glycosyltransferase family A protein [Bryobacteraceae bacterium]
MIPRPTLAMLIPAYNAARYLPRLLDSATRQTKRFDEIWVYDDCSTDDTGAIGARYGARVVRGDVNRGCCHGKNRLASETRCEWIHFHDADDELMPNFVERAHVWVSDGRFDVVFLAFEARDDRTGGFMGRAWFDPSAVSTNPRAYLIRNQVNNFGLYRREAFLEVGGYDEDPLVRYNDEMALHIRLAFKGLSFGADDTVVAINHRRSDSMSAANPLKCAQAQYQVLRKTAAFRGAEQYADDIARKLWFVVGGLSAHLDWRTADEAASLAIRLAGPSGVPTSCVFRTLCYASPYLAIRIREWLIRGLNPALREGCPGWRAGLR